MTRRPSNLHPRLPIEEHLPDIVSGVSQHSISVIEASPGSGKSTLFPLALMDAPCMKGQKILVLQPRRLAARAVASRMAEILSERVGDRIGYHMRFDRVVSKITVVEVITEGILTRRLINDPSLPGVGAIIFDEFHERSLNLDVGFSLALEALGAVRPDLKLILMSATLGESIPHGLLESAWRYHFEGTPYPVRIIFSAPEPRTLIWERVTQAVKSALLQHEGDILAFLPGEYEIHKAKAALEAAAGSNLILPLYGNLPVEEQSRVIHPQPGGRRRVILSTPIAETSITIDGVGVVIDSGFHNVARVSIHGVPLLVTEPISRDAANQRAGRAGRTGPGVCIRLWSEQEHQARRPFREPEVLRTDLSQVALDLAAWGISDLESFSWLTRPPKPSLMQAQELLHSLHALSTNGRISERGRILQTLGAHPRLAALAVKSRELKLEELGANLLAILEARERFSDKERGANIENRLSALSTKKRARHGSNYSILSADHWLARIRAIPKTLKNTGPASIPEDEAPGVLLATAYPELIAKQRELGSHRYLLSCGKGATLMQGDPLSRYEYLAISSLRGSEPDLTIALAAPVSDQALLNTLPHLFEEKITANVDTATGALTCIRSTMIGALTVTSQRDHSPSREAISEAFAVWLSSDTGFAQIPWSPSAIRLRSRILWAQRNAPQHPLPDLSDSTLRATLTEWLVPLLPSPPRLKDLSSKLVEQALDNLLSWPQKQELEARAPQSVTLPSGRQREIHYPPDGDPYFSAKIQELFGLGQAPSVGTPQFAPTIHLLSPAGRPVQLTRDLASFWRNGYLDVRRELRGRYPKHQWPEDPLQRIVTKR